jgi:two-component system alkaline phosphatase synthesis response regulator PhoP
VGDGELDKRAIILIVEDERHILTVLEYNLKLEGFEVYLAEDGFAGLELAGHVRPDVILLDWMLPQIDGLTVLSKLKEAARTRDIPVFMLTAKGMPEDIEQALGAGADDYITKPFNPTQLGGMIRKKLESMAEPAPCG